MKKSSIIEDEFEITHGAPVTKYIVNGKYTKDSLYNMFKEYITDLVDGILKTNRAFDYMSFINENITDDIPVYSDAARNMLFKDFPDGDIPLSEIIRVKSMISNAIKSSIIYEDETADERDKRLYTTYFGDKSDIEALEEVLLGNEYNLSFGPKCTLVVHFNHTGPQYNGVRSTQSLDTAARDKLLLVCKKLRKRIGTFHQFIIIHVHENRTFTIEYV